jgi:hypothetical protein
MDFTPSPAKPLGHFASYRNSPKAQGKATFLTSLGAADFLRSSIAPMSQGQTRRGDVMSYSPKGAKTMMNMSSLPEIPHGQSDASIIREMQKEKERLHRYF